MISCDSVVINGRGKFLIVYKLGFYHVRIHKQNFNSADCIKSWSVHKTFDCFRDPDYTKQSGTLQKPILLGVHQNCKLKSKKAENKETGCGFTMKIDDEVHEYLPQKSRKTYFWNMRKQHI